MREYAEDPLEYARGLIEKGDKYYETHREAIQKAQKHWKLQSDHMTVRGAIPGRKGNYIPELHPAIFSRATKIFNAFLQGDPPIKLQSRPGIPPNTMIEQGIARVETWLNNCFLEGSLWSAWFEAIVNAELYPYSIIYVGWDERFGPVPEYNTLQNKIDYKDYIVFAGPYIEAIPIENYRGDFSARRQKDMTFHSRAKMVDIGYIRANARQGLYPFYDQTRENEIIKSDWATQRKTERMQQGYWLLDNEQVELIELDCLIWDERGSQNVWRRVTFAGSMLLNERPMPYAPLGPSYKLITSKIMPGEVSGIPTSELGDKTQNIINEIWNQMLEANEQAIWSPTLFEGDVTPNPVWEPMSLWQVDDSASFKKLVEPSLSGDQLNFIKFLEEKTQQTLTAYDITQPLQQGSKQTLGEYMSKHQFHNDIMNVTLNLYADALCDLSKIALGMAREMLPTWISLKMFGPNPILNQLTIPDLANDMVVDTPRVRGISLEGMEIIKWQGLYSQLLGSPLIQGNLGRLYELTRRFLESQNVKDIEEIIGTSEEAMMQDALMKQLMASMPPLGMEQTGGAYGGQRQANPNPVGRGQGR
jgi:hypothetical protein